MVFKCPVFGFPLYFCFSSVDSDVDSEQFDSNDDENDDQNFEEILTEEDVTENSHLYDVTNDFECTECGMAFLTLDNLEGHVSVN